MFVPLCALKAMIGWLLWCIKHGPVSINMQIGTTYGNMYSVSDVMCWSDSMLSSGAVKYTIVWCAGPLPPSYYIWLQLV